MKKLALGAAILAALPVTAQAQDATGLFAGPYVGVQGGWSKRSIDEPGIDASRSGLDYGAYFGFDSPLGTSLVVGGEAEIGVGGKALRETSAAGTLRIDPKWNWGISGRAGFLASESMLFYGRVGYGREQVRTTFTDAVAPANSFTDKGWSDGVFYGGGIEYALNPSTSVRAEYRYKDFDGSYNPQQFLLGASFRF